MDPLEGDTKTDPHQRWQAHAAEWPLTEKRVTFSRLFIYKILFSMKPNPWGQIALERH